MASRLAALWEVVFGVAFFSLRAWAAQTPQKNLPQILKIECEHPGQAKKFLIEHC